VPPVAPTHCIHSFLILDYSLIYYFVLCQWFTLVILSTILFIHRLDYVARPRLLPPTEIIHYSNPGHHGTGVGVDTRPLVLRAVGTYEVVIILKTCLIIAFITSGAL
jgi:hypothetical protein